MGSTPVDIDLASSCADLSIDEAVRQHDLKEAR
jgi:hypothetical protein